LFIKMKSAAPVIVGIGHLYNKDSPFWLALSNGLRYNSAIHSEYTMPEQTGEITRLLRKWREGNRGAENELFALVYPNLRRVAHYLMKGERKDHFLQPTELVDQIYFRLVAAKDRDWQNRRHFYAIAGRVMRQYLIDCARKRPAADFVVMEGVEQFLPADSAKLDLAITIDRLLERLAETKPAWCKVVEVKYFLGLGDQEAAEALGMKLRTMQRMWRDARLWLFAQMESADAAPSRG
jgi:RNA polymerase sigma factor (TIGR02999 family)